ncbi:hypothetical protein NEDG_00058 [Nematocida displodere]|uniref:Uncharacterized protein n=1 Tax=Nematocida displodere TaxID=1805483 RepID=A0A177EHY1_9MICR|nr:hypothetical protein NEDG_00058 [Nematocida displodere]
MYIGNEKTMTFTNTPDMDGMGGIKDQGEECVPKHAVETDWGEESAAFGEFVGCKETRGSVGEWVADFGSVDVQAPKSLPSNEALKAYYSHDHRKSKSERNGVENVCFSLDEDQSLLLDDSDTENLDTLVQTPLPASFCNLSISLEQAVAELKWSTERLETQIMEYRANARSAVEALEDGWPRMAQIENSLSQVRKKHRDRLWKVLDRQKGLGSGVLKVLVDIQPLVVQLEAMLSKSKLFLQNIQVFGLVFGLVRDKMNSEAILATMGPVDKTEILRINKDIYQKTSDLEIDINMYMCGVKQAERMYRDCMGAEASYQPPQPVPLFAFLECLSLAAVVTYTQSLITSQFLTLGGIYQSGFYACAVLSLMLGHLGITVVDGAKLYKSMVHAHATSPSTNKSPKNTSGYIVPGTVLLFGVLGFLIGYMVIISTYSHLIVWLLGAGYLANVFLLVIWPHISERYFEGRTCTTYPNLLAQAVVILALASVLRCLFSSGGHFAIPMRSVVLF